MKKNEALAVFNSRIVNNQVETEFLHDKQELKSEIRKLANNDEGFENVVFELGCSVLAKEYLKQINNNESE
jgi:hypothetical protein|nr:MAG TPA: hypothetical protein [Caudoviricetes sp.]